MFKSFYQMTYNSFTKDIKVDDSYQTQDFAEANARLGYLKDTLGIGIFTGNPGVGKTLAVRNFVDGLNPNLFTVAYVKLSTVSVVEFYKALSIALNLEPMFRKIDMFNNIQKHIESLHKDMKKTVVLVVDESQYLNTNILHDLKMLLNFSMDSKDHAILILIGLPSLTYTLSKRVHESLYQRIVINYNFEGINRDEVKGYIDSRLKLVKCEINMFDTQAIEALYNNCNGSIRQLNNLITKCLILGAQQNQRIIDAQTVMLANQEVRLT